MLFWVIFGNFWCPEVTLVTFSSNISNFERNPEKHQNIEEEKGKKKEKKNQNYPKKSLKKKNP